jgi:hypothetical protein
MYEVEVRTGQDRPHTELVDQEGIARLGIMTSRTLSRASLLLETITIGLSQFSIPSK